MTGTIATVFGMLSANRTAWRRARNLRAATRAPRPAVVAAPRRTAPAGATPAPRFDARRWLGAAAAVLFAIAGAVVIATHARVLAGAADSAAGGSAASVAAFQAALPGVAFSVPARAGVTLQDAGQGALVIAAGMHAEAPVRIDLCSQVLDRAHPRLLPLHIGYRFDDVARWVARNDAAASPVTLRNVVLAGPATTMPKVDIGGTLAAPTLRWDGGATPARWIGDASGGAVTAGVRGDAALGQQGWLVWNGDAALRIVRRASALCPQGGELVLQLYGPAGAAGPSKALVSAFPTHGAPVSAWLAPGEYRIPALPAAELEDQALFEQLHARRLVRLAPIGLVELAPPDLAAYQAAPPAERTGALAGWSGVSLDDGARKLLDRLYRRADGDYVREQVRVFNSERRLLAWRLRAPAVNGAWQASVAGAPVTLATTMPAAAARLFAELPQGWGSWTRIAAWPGAGDAAGARLSLALARPAAAGDTLQVLLAGRVTSVGGARLRHAPQGACTGRACPAPGAVQQVELDLLPGATSVTIDAAPLDMAGLAEPGDRQYRHLRLAGGDIAWQSLPDNAGAARTAAAAVNLADRHGARLWSEGVPSAAAASAGLAPLLGLRAEHVNSVAGMLARLPSASGLPHDARLTLDLALQAASQAALECIGMRHGRFDGRRCSGVAAVPEGREAGLVVLDAETGDVLAAAGAQAGHADPANWDELRDFDRADPARSPLRLPAFQHDGGANSSPGSTFKVISALGLEQAARHDPRLDALLGGLPLARINRIARAAGFAFRTDAAAYPADTRLAHITNFRDEHLDPLAHDGRLGLAEALTYSLNTWFAWTGELSDRSLFGRPEGGAPDLQALEPGALAPVRPIVDMAHRLGFERPLRLDGGLLPPDYPWSPWDALQGTPAHIDPVHSRHELRQMSIGLRMQVTPLQMALAAGAVGQGRVIAPRLLLALDGREAASAAGPALGVRLDRIRAGMKGVVDTGTAAGAFRGARFAALRAGLYGKTGTAPTGARDAAGHGLSTVWFTCWLEPGTIPGQAHRLALAAYVSRSDATGGEHAAPIVAAVLQSMLPRNLEQKGI